MSVLNTINEKESKDTNRLSLNKLEGGKSFKITSNFKPSGDQPAAIKELCQGLNDKQKNQVLLGVTGSGKTFTCLLYTSPSPRDRYGSRMPSSA